MTFILPSGSAAAPSAVPPHVSAERQIAFWLGAFILLCIVLWVLGNVLVPFIIGLAIGYMADPAADKMEADGFSRRTAALTIVGGFSAVFLAFMAIIGPLLFDQASRLIENAPQLIKEARQTLAPWTHWITRRIEQTGGQEITQAIKEQIGDSSQISTAIGGSVVAGLQAGTQVIAQIAMLTVITPIVAFFTIKEWDVMIKWLRDLLPRRHAPAIESMSGEIGARLSGFVRGQITVCAILGAFYAAALAIAGLNYGLVIGMAAGILSIIPLVGSTVGLVVGVLVAWFQTHEWTYVAIVAGIFGLGQFLEGNFLTPKIVGDRVGLHPLWVLLAIMAGGALFNIVGMLIAVPVAIVISVLATFAINRYKASPLYKDVSVLSAHDADHGPSDPV